MNELIKTEQVIQADWEVVNERSYGYCFRVCVAKNYDYAECDGSCYGQSQYDYLNEGETVPFYIHQANEFIIRNPEVSVEGLQFYLKERWGLNPGVSKGLAEDVFQKFLLNKQP